MLITIEAEHVIRGVHLSVQHPSPLCSRESCCPGQHTSSSMPQPSTCTQELYKQQLNVHTAATHSSCTLRQCQSTVETTGTHCCAGVKQIWAVHHAEAQTDSGMQVAPQGGPHHAFLFMSDPQASQTTVMRLGDGMDRVVQDDGCGMVFTAPTVVAANLLNHTRIIQV